MFQPPPVFPTLLSVLCLVEEQKFTIHLSSEREEHYIFQILVTNHFLTFIFQLTFGFFFLFFFLKVPVFDARQVPQDTQFDFDNLPESFPRFDEEIPIGSCVVIGHSISTYPGKKDDAERLGTDIHLATNVLFVILLGTPLA